MMHALAHSHLHTNRMTPRQFFRSAYMWKWSKDIPDTSLCNDLKLFDEHGRVPGYVADYLVHCYGVQ